MIRCYKTKFKDFIMSSEKYLFIKKVNELTAINTKYQIPFSSVYLDQNDEECILDCMRTAKIGGMGPYSEKCLRFFKTKYGFNYSVLTPSCTDALEMSSILLDFSNDDEIIIPSFSFVSSALPFALRNAHIVFADSMANNPNIDLDRIENLITSKTKAVLVVHYGGYACDINKLISICKKYNLFIIEDAAHCINSFYDSKPLGSFGDFGVFSFHETKNISCGEGGLLVVNNTGYFERAEIIRDKGTNRSDFFLGKVDKYSWVDVGSSFVLSDILAALLYAQLRKIQEIQTHRLTVWNTYKTELEQLEEKGKCRITHVPEFATNNAHLFYIICKNHKERSKLLSYLQIYGINASFHYQSLHSSKYFKAKHDGRELPNSEKYSNCLLRLPISANMGIPEAEFVVKHVLSFYKTI